MHSTVNWYITLELYVSREYNHRVSVPRKPQSSSSSTLLDILSLYSSSYCSIQGLSGRYPDILNISRTGCVALM